MKVSDLNRAIQNIDDVYLEIADAPDKEKLKMTTHINRKKFIVIGLAACLAICLAITAYAFGGEIIGLIFGWGNNMQVKTFRDENGLDVSEVTVFTDNLTEPVIIRDSRMIFVVNDEHIDVTDRVSVEESFCYEYKDKDGITHLWLVGLLDENLEHYGYAEYLKDENGDWIGGYDARINMEADGHSAAGWLETAKEDNGISR